MRRIWQGLDQPKVNWGSLRAKKLNWLFIMDPLVWFWWNFYMKLPRGSPNLLTPFPAFSGTFMFSKTPERYLKGMDTHDIDQDVWSWVFENMEVPDKAWDEVMRLGKSLRKLSWKFHWDQRSWTLLRLSVSFKFLSGLLKQMKVSDKTGYDVRTICE